MDETSAVLFYITLGFVYAESEIIDYLTLLLKMKTSKVQLKVEQIHLNVIVLKICLSMEGVVEVARELGSRSEWDGMRVRI